MESPRVVIVGSSYSAGVVFYFLQNYLSKSRQPFDLLLISDKNHFSFKSLFPQLLSSLASRTNIGQELRSLILLRSGLSYLESNVLDIDFQTKIIITSKGEVSYKYLVLAPENDISSVEPFISKKNNLFKFSSLNDVYKLKYHILNCLELASFEKNIDKKKKYLTFSIIGSMKEGVEVSTTLYDFVCDLIKRKFPELNSNLLTINLMQKNNTISFDKDPFFNSRIFYYLNRKRINVSFNFKVDKIDEKKIEASNEQMFFGTVINLEVDMISSLIRGLKLKKDEQDFACVDLYLKAQGLENVFIVGESSKSLDLNYNLLSKDNFYKEQAQLCAYNTFAEINNIPLKPMKINNNVDFLFLGNKASILEIKGLYFDGLFAWILHRLFNILCFLGLRKRIILLIDFLLRLIGLRDSDTFNLRELVLNKELVKK